MQREAERRLERSENACVSAYLQAPDGAMVPRSAHIEALELLDQRVAIGLVLIDRIHLCRTHSRYTTRDPPGEQGSVQLCPTQTGRATSRRTKQTARTLSRFAHAMSEHAGFHELGLTCFPNTKAQMRGKAGQYTREDSQPWVGTIWGHGGIADSDTQEIRYTMQH